VSTASRDRLAATVATLTVVAAVAAGVYLLNSPSEERALRLDERRVSDLSDIADAVDLYWRRHGRLPASLDELRQEPTGVANWYAPPPGPPYEYRPLVEKSYEVCATFERDSAAGHRGGVSGDVWAHRAGRQCFKREPRTPQR
jgi:hypothetical protein